MGTTTTPWTPTPEQQAETTDDLDDAFKTLEWRMWRKSLFYSWSHEQWTAVGTAMRTLVELCDADLTRAEQPQRSK